MTALKIVLAVGLVLRVAAEVAYAPGLLFSDSWAYVQLANSPGFAPDRPSGYPVLMAILGLPGTSLFVVTAAQHLAGLATGALAAALLLRLRIPAAAAAAVTALIVLDAYAIALEQHVMAEAFFTLAVTASMYLAVRGKTPAAIAASGLLLGGATTMRTLGLFAIPVWIAYVAWRHWDRGKVLPATALAAAAAPLLVYCALHAAAGKGFKLTAVDGWGAYSRVAPFADCDGADIPDDTRPLCQPPDVRNPAPSYYGWDPDSPANRLFGGDKVAGNERVRAFATAIIRHQPLDYAEAVATDFGKFFRPSGGGSDGRGDHREPIHFPAEDDTEFASDFARQVRAEHIPGYERRIRPPAALLRAYESVFHTPRPLIALLTLAALAGLAVRGPRRKEIFLLAGSGLAMLLAAAMVEFQIRYLLPSVPLIACAGALGIADLAARRSVSSAHGNEA